MKDRLNTVGAELRFGTVGCRLQKHRSEVVYAGVTEDQHWGALGILITLPVTGGGAILHAAKRRLVDGDSADEAGRRGFNDAWVTGSLEVGAKVGEGVGHVVGYVAKQVTGEVVKNMVSGKK